MGERIDNFLDRRWIVFREDRIQGVGALTVNGLGTTVQQFVEQPLLVAEVMVDAPGAGARPCPQLLDGDRFGSPFGVAVEGCFENRPPSLGGTIAP